VSLPPYGLRPGDALSLVQIPPLLRAVKANADSTGGALTAWESTFAAGVASPLHVHHDAAEFFYVLEGAVSFYLDGQWFEAEPGAFVAVPSGARHGFRVSSPQTRMLAMFSPAAMLGMWEEIAALGGKVDPATYASLCDKYSMQEFGPLPDS
jgi:quercetin dioxygenase-like cupin family protein